MYAKKFSKETSREWSAQDEYNRVFLRAQVQYFNDKLRAQGHLFLNEVYDALSLSRTRTGAVVGWTIRDGHEDYVSIDVTAGPDGTGAYILDFNVPRNILDFLPE